MTNNTGTPAHRYQFNDPEEKLDFTGERYVSGYPGQTQHAHHHRYIFAVPFCEGKTVLDVACGEGYGTNLIGTVAASTVGVDIDESIIEFARRNHGAARLHFLCAPARNIPINNKNFDVIVSFETIEHFSEHDEFLQEINRLLKDDGLFIISSPNRDIYTVRNKYCNPFHMKELDLHQFERSLRSYFCNVHIFAQRQTCGSYILPLTIQAGTVDTFNTTDSLSYDHGDTFTSPEYFIALASNAPLPHSAGSILSNDTYIAEQQQSARREALRADTALKQVNEVERKLKQSQDLYQSLKSESSKISAQLEALNAAAQNGFARLADIASSMREYTRTTTGQAQNLSEIRTINNEILQRLENIERQNNRSLWQMITLSPGMRNAPAKRLLIKLKAAWRHPRNSAKRRTYRLRENSRHSAASEPPSWSSPAPTPSPTSIDDTRPADRQTAVHATLFERWVANSLGEYAGSDFVPVARTAPPAERSDVQLIAYYLPQFHPIPENDRWWGKGFTEWRSVTRAYPHFDGHYQPRIPGELGYYDLRIVDVMRRQVELAKLYGIHAFCFHFYWFAGKTLLETPIRNYLENRDFALPFCLCWANENWSRRWDGSENEVLIAQKHSPEDDIAFLRHLNQYFQDERYLKIDGRPVLTVYRPSLFPDAAGTLQRWRGLARELGYPGLYLIATNAFGFNDYKQFGFDALSEFPPHHVHTTNIQNTLELSKFRTGLRIRSYEEIVESERNRAGSQGSVHPGIMLSWDNSARRPANGEIIHGSTPALFKRWLKQCFSRAQSNAVNERLVFINAWNEWAEGTYLEPDRRFGYAYLSACADVLREHVHKPEHSVSVVPGIPEWSADAKTVLLCSHHSGSQIFGGERSFLDVLRALNGNGLNVVVTLQEGVNVEYIQTLRAFAQEIRIFPYQQWTANANASLESLPHFLAVLEDIRADLVYVNTIVVVAPLLAARLRGIPAIVHAREIISGDTDLQAQIGTTCPEIVNQVGRSAAQIIANSEATAASFATQPHIALIPNTVDIDEFDILNRDDVSSVRFGLISSNLPKKGIEDVIELARLCEPLVRRARFVIIGPLHQPNIQQYLDGTRDVPSNVEFVDYIPSSVEALGSIDVVLNFSYFQESFGRSVLEGLAAGRPAIVYKWGALPELIEHGVSGFIIPYREPQVAVPHVRALCGRRTLTRMSQEAKKKAKRSLGRGAFDASIGELVTGVIDRNGADRQSYSEVRARRVAAHANEAIDIVVCIHNALDEVRTCLSSVAKCMGRRHRLILVDDGSDHPTRTYLEEFSAKYSFATLHRNDVALGYTKSANIGVRLSTGRLIILLNSDTVVTPFWAEKMADAVFSTHGAGIVGPVSNAASYQSLPGVTGTKTQTAVNVLPPNYSVDDMNLWCEAHTTARGACVPLVHGFCFGITRDAWNTLGEFDEVAFPEGYGEENDYCFRAVNAGFGLVVATHTYVFHAKSRSYSEQRRHALSEAAQKILYERYSRDRFLAAVKIISEQPILQRLRREAAKLWST
jgi:GT2 family glycosyltransferase/2-polyprenyl-3-methyl-5-hydroxy-6-metoxy-1,4-benzoquinol methylase/glycosyltransferase involved in cell wall biosynthesis